MSPDDKDAALLPYRIGGLWALIHRPMTPLGAHIWISYSPDLRHWGGHRVMMEARKGALVGRKQDRPVVAANRN